MNELDLASESVPEDLDLTEETSVHTSECLLYHISKDRTSKCTPSVKKKAK